MRLRITKQIFDENVPLLILKIEKINRGNNVMAYKLTNSKELQKAITEISRLGLFENRISNIKKYPLYTHSENSIIFSENEFQSLSVEIKHLLEECTNLANAISQLIKKEDPNLISIKIPEPKDFADLERIASKLNIIFSQTLFADEIKGSVKVANFDNGSYWIDILVTGATVINVIAGLAWSGVVVYKKLQEGRLIQEKVREMKISNNAIEEIIDKSKDAVNVVASSEANFLYNTFYKGKDNEQVERIKLALKELAELYSQGGEIHPALAASSQIKNEFPDFKKLDKIETKIHKLENTKK
jgi:hypothetical protein